MEENEVFWFGRRPKPAADQGQFADREEFAAAIQEACAEYGCRPKRFVSALGRYGTWVVEFERDGRPQRIVWNGREHALVLQVRRTAGGWDEPGATTVERIDVPAFRAGIGRLLGTSGPAGG